MENKENGWIILDKSLLTHEELEYLDGIRLRLLIAKLEGSSNVTTKVGRGMKELVEDEDVIKAFGGELTLENLEKALKLKETKEEGEINEPSEET